MANKTTFIVQTFELKRKRLVPGDRQPAPTDHGARKRAEALSARKPGAAALKVAADDETGELESIEILAKFGDVPDDFEESLAA
ncbi:hypothetical protein [Methylobacterium radiotolerans]